MTTIPVIYSYHHMQSVNGNQAAVMHIPCRPIGWGWMTWCGKPIKKANDTEAEVQDICPRCVKAAGRVGESIARALGASK